jgi:hypothetical protein
VRVWWRTLYINDIRDLYTSPGIFQIMKSRRTKRSGHVARKGERQAANCLLVLLFDPEMEALYRAEKSMNFI